MDDEILRSHSRQQQDKTKYEFTMKLTAFNIKEAVLDGSISAKDQLLRYKQGDGITLRSVEYHAFKYNVRFRDIFCGDIQLFEKLTHHSNIQIFFTPLVEQEMQDFMDQYTKHFCVWYMVIASKPCGC